MIYLQLGGASATRTGRIGLEFISDRAKTSLGMSVEHVTLVDGIAWTRWEPLGELLVLTAPSPQAILMEKVARAIARGELHGSSAQDLALSILHSAIKEEAEFPIQDLQANFPEWTEVALSGGMEEDYV